MRAATEMVKTPASQRRWLAGLWRRSPRAMGWAFLAPIVIGMLFVVQAYLLAYVLDAAIRLQQPIHALWSAIGAIAALIVLRAVFGWSGQRAASRAVEQIKQQLRAQIFAQMLRRGPAWTRQHPSGELAALLVEHIEALDGYLRNFLPAMYAAGLLPIIFTLAVLPTDWIVALLFIISAPMIPVFMALIGWGAEAVNRKHQTILSQLSGVFGDRIKGVFTLSLFGRTEAEIQEVKQANDRLNQATMGVLRIAFLSSAVLELFAALGVAGVAVYIGFSYLGSFGEGFSGYTLQHGLFCLLIAPEVYNPLRQLAAGYHERSTAKAAVEQLEEMLVELPPAPPQSNKGKNEAKSKAEESFVPKSKATDAFIASGGVSTHQATGPVGSATVRCLWEDQPEQLLAIQDGVLTTPQSNDLVLGDIQLQLARGAHVALMGPSGSGKTSLLETLIGLRTPAQGQWLQWRAPVENVQSSSQLIPATILISQQPFLTMGSVRELLRLADPEADDAQLWAALARAQAEEFVRALPQGLDTELGTRGFGLSGGQAHRVALARLFLGEPQLVLLDEPTAYLDPQTRDEVMAEILQFCQGRGLIVATHDRAVADQLEQHWQIAAQKIEVMS